MRDRVEVLHGVPFLYLKYMESTQTSRKTGVFYEETHHEIIILDTLKHRARYGKIF